MSHATTSVPSSSPSIRIALSTSSLIRPLTGIGQYTLHLSQALASIPDIELHCFYGYGWSDEAVMREIPHLASIKKWFKRVVPSPYEVSRSLQQTRFNQGASRRKPDLYHEPNFLPFHFDGPTVLTVHDLSYVHHPETHPELRVRVMNKLLPQAIEKAAHLLADSEFTRQEIITEFGIAPDRVTTTLLGVSKDFTPRPLQQCAKVLQAHRLDYGRYVLAVGTLEPRKNLLQVIRAYAALPKDFARRTPLVIVGGSGWKSEGTEQELDALLADGRARRLGFVSSDDLPIIYSAAQAFVYPSLYEGFGLPAVEAMASGVPVIVSDRASLPEVVGDAGISLSPEDVTGMRNALLRMGEDAAERQRLAAAGVAQASQFTWARCGRQTADVYRRVLGRA